jgi:hypothetical protein
LRQLLQAADTDTYCRFLTETCSRHCGSPA